MPIFYVQTDTKKRAADGERYRGFVFETSDVDTVADFADVLSDDEMVKGFRLEIWTGPDGRDVVTRYPLAVSKRGVVTVSEYQKPQTFQRG